MQNKLITTIFSLIPPTKEYFMHLLLVRLDLNIFKVKMRNKLITTIFSLIPPTKEYFMHLLLLLFYFLLFIVYFFHFFHKPTSINKALYHISKLIE
jgi:hypothetical protein